VNNEQADGIHLHMLNKKWRNILSLDNWIHA